MDAGVLIENDKIPLLNTDNQPPKNAAIIKKSSNKFSPDGSGKRIAQKEEKTQRGDMAMWNSVP